MSYAGRLAIIAGGLGGLGTSIAQLLRSKGARVALLYAPFEASRKDAIVKQIYGPDSQSSSSGDWQLPEDITTHECDITSEKSVQKAFNSLPINQFNHNADSTTSLPAASITSSSPTNNSFPSILINAAGYVTVTPLEDTTLEEAHNNIIPNLIGPFLCSKAFYHLYRAQVEAHAAANAKPPPPGRIVSISSQAAHVALHGHGPYCASKAGLLGLTRCMALEWAGKGITSNTVSPTVVMTSLGKKAWADPIKRDDMLSQIPTGTFAEPEQIASAVEWLCRDDSGMVNGADIRVDGGFTIR